MVATRKIINRKNKSLLIKVNLTDLMNKKITSNSYITVYYITIRGITFFYGAISKQVCEKIHTLFQALLYNSIYCLYFNIKFINIQYFLSK